VARAAASTRTRDDGTVPDLVVLTRPALPDLAGGLLRDRVPHLAVSAGEAIGVVGPLVRPGRSACLRCVDLRKAEADPHWPKVAAQVTLAPRIRPEAGDTALTAMTAALACAQALALIDRAAGEPATVGGTLEVVLPDWQWRRRTWPPHPACDCGAAAWADRDEAQQAGLMP
jgi:bacteriocin biosynthesis cyclodehydratase domain-containing protein